MASPAQALKHRVLIVDDEETTRVVLAGMVSAELKAEVQLAGTCEQALRFAETQRYDAILLDLMMPGIGGFALLHRVRRSAPNAATPVLIVSADKQAAERCLSAGASACLVKPVKAAELGKLIRRHLGAPPKKP